MIELNLDNKQGLPGEVLKQVALGRKFAAEERARFVGIIPGRV